jgi:uncharacterized membrane protein YhaH (DUF805 family)
MISITSITSITSRSIGIRTITATTTTTIIIIIIIIIIMVVHLQPQLVRLTSTMSVIGAGFGLGCQGPKRYLRLASMARDGSSLVWYHMIAGPHHHRLPTTFPTINATTTTLTTTTIIVIIIIIIIIITILSLTLGRNIWGERGEGTGKQSVPSARFSAHEQKSPTAWTIIGYGHRSGRACPSPLHMHSCVHAAPSHLVRIISGYGRSMVLHRCTCTAVSMRHRVTWCA